MPQKNSFCKQKGWVLQPHLQPKTKVLATKRMVLVIQNHGFCYKKKGHATNQKGWFLQPKRLLMQPKAMALTTKKICFCNQQNDGSRMASATKKAIRTTKKWFLQKKTNIWSLQKMIVFEIPQPLFVSPKP